jgi:uncharacterized RDD family membrane protein YckC
VASRPRKPSAAQNVTVVLTCKQCGAVNRADAGTCCICDTRLSQTTTDIPVSTPSRPLTEGNLAVAPDWRNEVSSRLKAYRARHGREDPAQPEFVFGEAEDIAPAKAEADEEVAAASHVEDVPAKAALPRSQAAGPTPASRWRQAALPRPEAPGATGTFAPLARAGTERPKAERPSLDRLEIDVAQPAFDFREGDFHNGSRDAGGRGDSEQRTARPWRESLESGVYPVAPLRQRRRAGLLDAALLLFSYGAFLSLFVALGGRFTFSKTDLAVAGSTLALFYVLYVALFTFFGGTTPGMMLRHLRVVGFDGSNPTPGQLLWRSFGYVVSAGTFMFGFLAALWDDDTLCWHDRISQTYLTADSTAPESAAGGRS